jgi:hypothetical protein
MRQRTVPVEIPAGVPLLGQREPCLPVILGRAVKVQLPPGGRTEVRVEALSLSLYPHTPGTYEIAEPAPGEDDEYVKAARAVHQVWTRTAAGQLRSQPLKLAQLAVFANSGHVSAQDIRSMASDSEWQELQGLLKTPLSSTSSTSTTTRGPETPSSIVDITGGWRSSTGSLIRIADANFGPGRFFEILASGGSKQQNRYKAVWEGGFRQKFIYRTATGDTVIGIVMPEGNEVRLVNQNNTWSATWKR